MDSSEEVSGGFFIAGCNASELFEDVEETLDEIAFGVKRKITFAAHFAVGFGRDHRLDTAHGQGFDEAVGVVTLVGDEGLRLNFGQQRFGLGDVVSLTAGQADRQRIAERVDDGVDFWSSTRRATARSLPRRRFFGRAGAMLMGAHNRCVDHGVFVVRIVRQGFEQTRPNAFLRPARKPRVDVLPSSEPLGKIAPRRAGTKLPDHRLDKKPIAQLAVPPDSARTTRKQTLNPRELIVAQRVAPHRKPPKLKAPHESRFQ